MDMTKATPQEITEYKCKWMMKGPKPVRLHSDLVISGKDWCRKHLQRWQWKMNTYTDVYEHTFFFENDEYAQAFEDAMPAEFVNQIFNTFDYEQYNKEPDDSFLEDVNRVEVIDSNGRSYVNYLKDGEKVTMSLQDDNQTLKIFI